MIDAGVVLDQPRVEHVANEDLAALILEMNNASKASAGASKAKSDASKVNADAFKSLVKSTADNTKLSNDSSSKIMQKLVTKNQAP